ncbi:hypothetical protein [Marinospirillum minutulum]|uniref:hypothetical protein n=1 Tax=Marinospirillum minutulum TaxID=64974 RepID=UPI000422743C|nr:hypothetical protein [Marinospirillum minutulum]
MSFFKSDLFILAFGKLIHLVFMFSAIKVYTTLLPDSEVGNLILILSVTMFFSLVFINPVGVFINRKLNKWVAEDTVWVALFAFNFYVLLISIFSLFVPAALNYFKIGSNINSLYFSFILFFFIIFNTWNQTIIPALNLLFYRKEFVFFTLFSVFMYVSLAAIFVYFIEAKAHFWLLGQIIGLGLGAIISTVYLYRKIPNTSVQLFRISTEGISGVFRFSSFIAISTVLLWFSGNAYKFVIEYNYGPEALAYIGLALTLAFSLVGAIETVVLQVYHAPYYSKISSTSSYLERSAAFQELINNTIPVVFGSILALIAALPYLLVFLTDPRFYSILIYVIPATIFEFFRVMTNILGHAAQSEYKTSQNIKSYFLGFLVVVVGLAISISTVEWQFAIILTLLISWVTSFFFMYFTSKKLLDFSFPYHEIILIAVIFFPVLLLSYCFNELAFNLYFSFAFIFVIAAYSLLVLYKRYFIRA